MVCSRQRRNGLVKNILLIVLITLNKNMDFFLFFFYLHCHYSIYFIFIPCWCWEIIEKQECWQVGGALGIPNIEVCVSERHCWKVVAFHTYFKFKTPNCLYAEAKKRTFITLLKDYASYWSVWLFYMQYDGIKSRANVSSVFHWICVLVINKWRVLFFLITFFSRKFIKSCLCYVINHILVRLVNRDKIAFPTYSMFSCVINTSFTVVSASQSPVFFILTLPWYFV